MNLPKPPTLKKYGLTADDYVSLYEQQGGKCAICGNDLEGRRTNIDHQHGIRGWKKLPPDVRKQTVRGILCWTCNKLIVGRGVTIERLEKALCYLQRFKASAALSAPAEGRS